MRLFRRKTTQNDPFDGVAMGNVARDTISGFEGRVCGRIEFITGCNQVLLVPRVKDDGEYREGHWFDVERVEVTEELVVEEIDRRKGPLAPPPERNGP